MPTRFSFGKIEFDVSLGTPAPRAPVEPETPFHLAVLGDFSGRSSRGVREAIAQRPIWPIDCDNFEQVMARLGVVLRLPVPPAVGATLDLRCESLEDFHPDRILNRVGLLPKFAETRKRLLNPATASAAAEELHRLLARPAPPPANAPQDAAPAESSEETLARLLGKAEATPPVRKAPSGGIDVQSLIRSIVAPSVVPGPTSEQAGLLSALDLELTSRLRAILHQPAFQALETAWRGLDLLVRNFGAEENIKLHLVDVTREELAADLQAHEALHLSGACRLIGSRTNDQPLAVVLGLYTFGDRLDEIEMLGRLAKISALAGAPFIAAASPHLVGCDSFDRQSHSDDWTRPIPADVREAWQAVRKLPEASSLGLALPRFLLRQPYGKESDAIDTFPFEELPADLPHESFLWGNPAILCGYLLAGAFQADGWQMRPSGYGEVGELPVYRFKAEGETKVKPCAEAWVSERAGDVIMEMGLMPVLSIKGRDAVRLVSFQSTRSPSTALAGRWG